MVAVSFGHIFSRPKEIVGDVIAGNRSEMLRINLIAITFLNNKVIDEEVVDSTIPTELNTFSFRISPKFTPTFEALISRTECVSVRYALAIIDDILETELYRTGVIIESDIGRLRRPLSLKEGVSLSAGVFCCCSSDPSQKIVFLVDGDANVCFAGDTITLHIEVYNYSSFKVENLRVKLRHTRTTQGKRSEEEINTVDFKGIEPGRYMPSFPVGFTFPKSLLPTAKSYALVSEYYVEIICVTSGSDNAMVKFPITILPPMKTNRNMHEST